MRDTLTVEAVQRAVAEYDQVGRDEFLKTYGFKPAKGYVLLVDGRAYDSKAIVGVAHKYLPSGRPLHPSEFSGGVEDAAGKLRALGFNVEGPEDDVDWSWEEHVLALDLYMASRASIPGKSSKPILELSSFLNRLAERRGIPRSPKFRNANGVYMKLMNFRRLDPDVQAAGRKGLVRGAKGEEAVWNAFAHDQAALSVAAAAIRLAVEDEAVALAEPDDAYEADESAVVLKLHRSRERDRKLIERKKAQALAATGKLTCEACDFDFEKAYGELGTGFIEAHHKKPVSTLRKGEKTRCADLALVCANCHRMLHRSRELLGLEQLKALLRPLRA